MINGGAGVPQQSFEETIHRVSLCGKLTTARIRNKYVWSSKSSNGSSRSINIYAMHSCCCCCRCVVVASSNSCHCKQNYFKIVCNNNKNNKKNLHTIYLCHATPTTQLQQACCRLLVARCSSLVAFAMQFQHESCEPCFRARLPAMAAEATATT